jgi:threonine/homoserine/homoserine lactone efflux protein
MSALLTGLTLGLSAGISPGPLTSLIIATALARGFGAGLRVALAPLITDTPIVLTSLLFVGSLPAWLRAALAGAGGLYVIYLGIETIRAARHAVIETGAIDTATLRADFRRGLLVNLLSPHPWLFWITIGSPLLLDLGRTNLWMAAAFLIGFYLLLVGSKVAIAAAIAGGRRWLTDRTYRLMLVGSGILLLVFGLLLFREALPSAL